MANTYALGTLAALAVISEAIEGIDAGYLAACVRSARQQGRTLAEWHQAAATRADAGTTSTSTTTAAATRADAPTAGYVITAEQLDWLPSDWADHFDGDGYALSVIHAASELSGLLRMADLRRLLEHHGQTVGALQMDLEQAQRAGHFTCDLQHAGQALTWLGY